MGKVLKKTNLKTKNPEIIQLIIQIEDVLLKLQNHLFNIFAYSEYIKNTNLLTF